MKYLKITLAIVALFAFSFSNAQDADAKKKKQFNKIDTNSDKSISLEELTAFYEGKTKKNGEAFDAEKVLKWKDANEDGKLSLEEFASQEKKKAKGKGKGNIKN